MQILIALPLIFCLTILQVAVINPLTNNFFIFNAPLIFIIFINWAKPNNSSLLLTIAISWAISYLSLISFALTVYSYLLTAYLVQYISLNKLTNRNFLSLVIAGLLGSFIYHVVLLLASFANKDVPVAEIKSMAVSPFSLITHLLILSGMLLLLKLNIFKHETKEIKVGF